DSILVTIPAGTANGSYNIKVTVTNSTGSGANNKNDNQNAGVVINVPTSVVTTTSINAPAITYNANGTVTVTVRSGSGTPTGNVSLSVDGGTAAPKALISGSATFTNTDIAALASPSAGDHSLSASYAAQGSFLASSATDNLHVDKATSTTTVTCPTNVTYSG